jgi:signal transduction histidine kinase
VLGGLVWGGLMGGQASAMAAIGTARLSGWPAVVLASADLSGQGANQTLNHRPGRVPLWRGLQTLPDPEGRLSVEEADAVMCAAIAGGTAQRLPSADHAYGRWIPYPYWARFAVRNDSAQDRSWVLSLESPTQDEVRLWQIADTAQRPVADTLSGHITPVAEQDAGATEFGAGQLFPSWRLALKAGEEKVFLLRLDGHNRMRFPLVAMADDAFASQQRWLSLGMGFVIAIPLVVLLYVLTLIRIAGDQSVPLFIVMALSELVGASWLSGLLHAVFPGVDRYACGWIGLFAYVVLLGTSCFHARLFLQTRIRDRLAHVVLTLLGCLWLVGLPLYALVAPEAARLCLLLGGTVHALALTFFALRGYRRNTDATAKSYEALFLTVWLVYLGAGVFYLCYRWLNFPVYTTLMVNFVQGSLVAALLGCALSVQVIRRRNQMLQEVERVQERNHLYASVHHDLWQPIQSIGLQVAALKDASGEHKTRIHRNIDGAISHVHDFVETLRQSNVPVQIQRVNLGELLEPLIDEYRLLASAKHISLRLHPVAYVLQTDPVLMQRILRNLLSNALRYTNAGGAIVIGTRRRAGRRWLMVYDNGIGMTPEQSARCFEVFARFADPGRVPEGMGLGLFSVKRMATQLGLATTLQSQIGRGTAIGLCLDTNIG